VRLVGAALQWIAWPLVQVGHTLRDGQWLHVTWTDEGGRHWEFVPDEARHQRYAPPLVFHGRVRRADRTGPWCP
jgi:hypothetical protein